MLTIHYLFILLTALRVSIIMRSPLFKKDKPKFSETVRLIELIKSQARTKTPRSKSHVILNYHAVL